MNRSTRNTTSKRTQAARVGLGALAATAALTALPAMASAATTCTFNPADIGGPTVTVNMDGGPGRPLTIQRNGAGEEIVVGAQGEAGQFCNSPDGQFTARLRTTVKIKVRSAINPAGTDTVLVDESRGPLRSSQTGHRPQIVLLTGTGGDTLGILGTNEPDHYTITGGPLQSSVQIGGEAGAPEILMTAMGRLFISGSGGDDFINATNVGVRAELHGGAGRDFMLGGRSGTDLIDAGPDADYVRMANTKGGDRAIGGDGPGDFFHGDAGDTATGFENTAGLIGKLKLASRTVTARAAKPAAVSMSWTHPKAWKNLRNITVRAHDGAKQVGTVTINPRSERITGSGALKLAESKTSIAKQGKTVTVRLGLLASKALAGKTLRLDVHAADRNGKRQVEPGAAELRVAK